MISGAAARRKLLQRGLDNYAADRETWDKQPHETPKAFAAFTFYRDAGVERALTRTAHTLRRSFMLVQRWSVSWRWVERAAAWDDHICRISTRAIEEERKKMAARHIKIAQEMQDKLVARMARMDPAELTPGEVRAWMETAVKIERLSLGEPTGDEGKIGSVAGASVHVFIERVGGGTAPPKPQVVEPSRPALPAAAPA